MLSNSGAGGLVNVHSEPDYANEWVARRGGPHQVCIKGGICVRAGGLPAPYGEDHPLRELRGLARGIA